MASRGASNACERGASNRRRGGEKGCLRRRCRSRDGFGRRETKCDRKVTGRREEGNKRKQRVAPPPKIAPSSGRQSAAVKEETVDPYILENFTGLCFILSFHD